MRDLVIEKLFDNKELTSEEIVYIARSLPLDVKDEVPYKHDSKDSLTACGITEDLVKDVNSKFSNALKIVVEEDGAELSRVVETIEVLAKNDPLMTRMLIIQAVKHAQIMSAGLGGLLGKLGLGKD